VIQRFLQVAVHNVLTFSIIGFMKQLPNLLKQETSSGACYVTNLMRMFANIENIADRDEKREEIEQKLIP
jgi:brefeldin A-inhibited guanine nucleotide-exchange protein